MATSTELIGLGVPSVQAAFIADGRSNVAPTFTNKAIAGASGSITQNAPAGRVQIAAGQSTITLTNSFINANSVIVCTVATNDTTAKSAAAVPGAGSASIVLNATATAITTVNYLVVN